MKRSADRAYIGKVASRYDEDRAAEPLWLAEEVFVRNLLSGWSPRATLLDVPVGTGRFLPLYVQRGLSVHGIDASEDMLNVARTKYSDAERIELSQGTAENLDLEIKSVDYAVCWRLAHLVSPELLNRIIAELTRVVRRQFAIQFYDIQPGRRTDRRTFDVWEELRSLGATALSKLPWASPWAHIPNYTHFSGDVEDCLRSLGVKINRIESIPDRVYRVVVYVVSCDS